MALSSATALSLFLAQVVNAQDCNGNGVHDSVDLNPTPVFSATDFPSESFVEAVLAFAIDHDGSRVPLDINGDGHTDVAVALHVGAPGGFPGGFLIHLNDGSGDLSSFVLYPCSQQICGSGFSIAAGNLTADDSHDVVFVTTPAPGGTDDVHVFLNDGAGNLTFDASYNIGGGTNTHVAIADLDGDGDLDIAVSSSGPKIGILHNDGFGAFTLGDVYEFGVAGGSAGPVAAADLDGDSDVDLIFGDGSSVTVLINSGRGTFRYAGSFQASADLYSVIISDVDSDGLPDILGASIPGRRIDVLRNLGGQPPIFDSPMSIFVTNRPAWLVAVDLDGDGDEDLVGAERFGAARQVVVLRNAGDGTFVEPLYIDQQYADFGPSVTVGDFDGNGAVDLVLIQFSAITVLYNDPLPPFSEDCNANDTPDECDLGNTLEFDPGFTVFVGKNYDPVAVTATAVDADHNVLPLDLNGDMLTDLVSANEAGSNVSVLLNAGFDGSSWLGFVEPHFDYDAGMGPTGISAGDLDGPVGDTHLDLAVADVLNGELYVLFNDGTGDFPAGDAQLILDSDALPDVTLADLDCDGLLDVAATGTDANGDGVIFVILNEGNRVFSNTPIEVPVGNLPRGIASADIDLDGHVDLAVANNMGNSVSVVENRCDIDGTFFPYPEILVGNEPFDVALVDLTGDGYPDIAVADAVGPPGLFVLINDGDGTFNFGPPVPYYVSDRASSLAVADFNGDAHLDLAVIRRLDNSVAVLLNTGDGSLTPIMKFNVGNFPAGVAAGDLDDDGQPDLVSADQMDDTVTVLRLNAVIPAVSTDTNENGIPDECECPWDCGGDNDGNVGIVDFLGLLAQWDQVGTPCDIDGGGVGINDFLELLANWGPCPK